MNNAEAIYKMLVPTVAPEPAKTPGEVNHEEWHRVRNGLSAEVAGRLWKTIPTDDREPWEASARAVLAMADKPKPLPTEDDVRAAGCEILESEDGWYVGGIIGRAAHWQYLRSDGTWTYDDKRRSHHPTREAALEAWGRRRS